MGMQKMNNIFTEEELKSLYELFNNSKSGGIDNRLGRSLVFIKNEDIPTSIFNKLFNIVSKMSESELVIHSALGVEYNGEYGQPNLPPHCDGSDSDIIVDFQLKANTSWDLGMETMVYTLEDNSALIFNPNEYIHWRPYKTFKQKEYVQMIFFRYYSKDHRKQWPNISHDDPRYISAVKFRESLKNDGIESGGK